MTTPTRLQLCPECQQAGISEVINHLRDGSILEATYLCPQSHVFQIKWLRPQPEKGVADAVVQSG